jgi:hypothetical protein
VLGKKYLHLRTIMRTTQDVKLRELLPHSVLTETSRTLYGVATIWETWNAFGVWVEMPLNTACWKTVTVRVVDPTAKICCEDRKWLELAEDRFQRQTLCGFCHSPVSGQRFYDQRDN